MPPKTEFELEWPSGTKVAGPSVQIIADGKDTKVCVNAFAKPMFIKKADLERFAVNILKALGSKKLFNEDDIKFIRAQKTRKRVLK